MTKPIAVFLASPNMPRLMAALYPTFHGASAKFQVISFCDRWANFAADMEQYQPEVVVIEADIAPDPQTLRDALMRLPGGMLAVVVLPATPGWPEARGMFEAVLTSVRGVFIAPVNWAQIASAAYTAGVTERTRTLAITPAAAIQATATAWGGRSPNAVIGTRVIAALSGPGGTGRSTITETLAFLYAMDNIHTLLVSLNSPPAVVGHLGLKFHPDATEWFNRPNPDGFRAALQQPKGLENLDVLVAPEDPEALATAAQRPVDDPTSIRNLILAAHSRNYGVVLLDLPAFVESTWATQAVLAANMVLLICRPNVHDQFAAVRTYQLLTTRLAKHHCLPPESLFAVINMKSPEDNMSVRDFAEGVRGFADGFPPVLAAFPYVAKLPAVQNRGQALALAPETEAFTQVARSLASKLIGGTLMDANEEQARSGGRSLFGIKFKLKLK